MASKLFGEGPGGLLMHHDLRSGAKGTVGQYVDALTRKVLELLRSSSRAMDREMADFTRQYLVSLKLDYDEAVSQGRLETLPDIIEEFRIMLEDIEARLRRPRRLAA